MDSLRRIKNILVLVCGVPCLVIVVAAIVSFELNKGKDMVLFDNRLDQSAEIVVDGKVVETLKPRGQYGAVSLVKLSQGAQEAVVRAGGSVVAKAPLGFRPRGKDEKHGFRGLFTVGEAPSYVLAGLTYSSGDADKGEPPSLDPVPAPKPLAELPRELEEFEISSIDTPFLKTISMPEGAKHVREKHLCRLIDGRLGCSGFPTLGR